MITQNEQREHWRAFGHLRFANRFEMGGAWAQGSDTNRQLVCFVCQSGKIGGAATMVYFTASTGKSDGVPLKAAALGAGMDLLTPPIAQNFSSQIVASVVAHECGHAFGLEDEHGDLRLGVSVLPMVIDHPNLQRGCCHRVPARRYRF